MVIINFLVHYLHLSSSFVDINPLGIDVPFNKENSNIIYNITDSPIIYEDDLNFNAVTSYTNYNSSVQNNLSITDSPIIYDNYDQYTADMDKQIEELVNDPRIYSSNISLSYNGSSVNNIFDSRSHKKSFNPGTESNSSKVRLGAYPWEEKQPHYEWINAKKHGEDALTERSYVAIISMRRDDKSVCGRCAGALITQMHVLTVARCFVQSYKDETGEVQTFSLGDFFVRVDSRNCNSGGTVMDLEEMYMHPRYSDTSFGLAVVQLFGKVDIDMISLATSPPADYRDDSEGVEYRDIGVHLGDSCQLYGWTDLPVQIRSENKTESDVMLKQLNVKLLSWTSCSKYDPNINEEVMLCGEVSSARVVPCPVMMGSPLLCRDIQYGLIVWELGCDSVEKPLVFVRTDSEAEWIRQVVAQEPYYSLARHTVPPKTCLPLYWTFLSTFTLRFIFHLS